MKTVCIYHSIDLDGYMSAAIVKHWFNTTNVSTIINEDGSTGIISKNLNTLTFIGYNYGDPIPDLSEYGRIIMCDISFPPKEMERIAMSGIGILNFIWIDHHKSAIDANYENYCGKTTNGIRNTRYAACELTWTWCFPDEPKPEIVRLLGMYDSFRHKGTDEELKVLEFQYGARNAITNYEEAYTCLKHELIRKIGNVMVPTNTTWEYILNNGTSIYSYLCTTAKQDYANGFDIILEEPVGDIVVARKCICINKERFNPINFGIDYHKDGYDACLCFHYANNLWNFSIYNDNGIVDCSSIAKSFGGGGHKGASGFRVRDINVFINNYKVR